MIINIIKNFFNNHRSSTNHALGISGHHWNVLNRYDRGNNQESTAASSSLAVLFGRVHLMAFDWLLPWMLQDHIFWHQWSLRIVDVDTTQHLRYSLFLASGIQFLSTTDGSTANKQVPENFHRWEASVTGTLTTNTFWEFLNNAVLSNQFETTLIVTGLSVLDSQTWNNLCVI